MALIRSRSRRLVRKLTELADLAGLDMKEASFWGERHPEDRERTPPIPKIRPRE
jgi:hypothetical protein